MEDRRMTDETMKRNWTRTVVAVDGPAGSGKSSVSRAAAAALAFAFLDTGAGYRSLAWLGLDQGTDLDDADAVVALLESWRFELSTDPADTRVRVNGTDVTAAIREPRVTAAVSAVAKIPQVRTRLNEQFRDLLDAPGEPGVIAEGRDITTVVAPDASVRVLLTADPAVRAARRASELDGVSAEVVDFMSAAEGVTTLDSTDLDFDQTVAALVGLVRGD
jgi:cytidylate kinase